MNMNLHLCVLIYIFSSTTSNKTGEKNEFKVESTVLYDILFYTQLTVITFQVNIKIKLSYDKERKKST